MLAISASPVEDPTVAAATVSDTTTHDLSSLARHAVCVSVIFFFVIFFIIVFACIASAKLNSDAEIKRLWKKINSTRSKIDAQVAFATGGFLSGSLSSVEGKDKGGKKAKILRCNPAMFPSSRTGTRPNGSLKLPLYNDLFATPRRTV